MNLNILLILVLNKLVASTLPLHISLVASDTLEEHWYNIKQKVIYRGPICIPELCIQLCLKFQWCL